MEAQSTNNISAIEPMSPAWNHMVRICFKPFSFKKWLALGFCAFLAQCGEQNGNSIQNIGNRPSTTIASEVTDLISNNVEAFIFIVVGVALLLITLIVLTFWLSSRGKFMLLDGIVKNRGDIKEPWREFKREGNSLCIFSIILTICMSGVFVLFAAIPLTIAIPDFQDEQLTGVGWTAIVVGSVLLLCYILGTIAVTFFTRVFLVPTMYQRRVKALEACRIAYSTFVKQHIGQSMLFLLFLFLLGIGASTIMIFGVCLTCCIGALPYVSSVLFLPITVFFACYALCYIQQFGHEWTFFSKMCRFCNYDLEGLEEGHTCPECGKK